MEIETYLATTHAGFNIGYVFVPLYMANHRCCKGRELQHILSISLYKYNEIHVFLWRNH